MITIIIQTLKKWKEGRKKEENKGLWMITISSIKTSSICGNKGRIKQMPKRMERNQTMIHLAGMAEMYMLCWISILKRLFTRVRRVVIR